MGIVWLLTIAFLYLLILKDLSQNAYMREYWQGAFLPMPPWSDPGWFVKSLNENIGIQFGIPYAVFLVFFLMLVGWVHVMRFSSEVASRITMLLRSSIVLVTLIASALQLYPIFERMILFLVPIGLILIGKAVEAIYVRLQTIRAFRRLRYTLLAGYLLYGPVGDLHSKLPRSQNTSSISVPPWKPYASLEGWRCAVRLERRTTRLSLLCAVLWTGNDLL